MKKLDKWLGYRFSSGTYTGEDYIAFQKEARADLKKKAQTSGCTLKKFLKNHYEFSAVLEENLTGKCIYVGISDVRYWQDAWYSNVLIRTMKNDSDWSGGRNNYCTWEEIPNAVRTLLDGEAV